MVIERSKQLTIRIAPLELNMLRALAEADGLTASDVLRQFVRRAYTERFGAQSPRTKGRRRS